MQKGGNVPDDFKTDEASQHENKKRVDQVGIHVSSRFQFPVSNWPPGLEAAV
jgi:hypothetical protein